MAAVRPKKAQPVARLYSYCLVDLCGDYRHLYSVRAVSILQKEGKTAKECGKEVEECQGLRDAFFTCKRGQIDNTNRIRGNKGY